MTERKSLLEVAYRRAAAIVTREARWQDERREPAGLREYVVRPSASELDLARILLDAEEQECE